MGAAAARGQAPADCCSEAAATANTQPNLNTAAPFNTSLSLSLTLNEHGATLSVCGVLFMYCALVITRHELARQWNDRNCGQCARYSRARPHAPSSDQSIHIHTENDLISSNITQAHNVSTSQNTKIVSTTPEAAQQRMSFTHSAHNFSNIHTNIRIHSRLLSIRSCERAMACRGQCAQWTPHD